MPLNLTLATLPDEITRALPKFSQHMSDMQRHRPSAYSQSFIKDGVTIKSIPSSNKSIMPAGLFTIEFSTEPLPSQRLTAPGDGINVRTVILHFNGDRKLLPPRTRNKFYFMRTPGGAIEIRKIVEKMSEVSVLYQVGIETKEQRRVDEIAAKAASEVAIKTLDERKKRMKESEGQREDIFAQLLETIVGHGRIESQVSGSYLNLALPNNVRLKIAVDAERVFVTEIDTPIFFKKEKIGQILGFLNKVGSL